VSSAELSTENESKTLVLVLFTFCPPGPLLLEVLKLNSAVKSLLCGGKLKVMKYFYFDN
jgi:hypothetical protein